jgi:polysaccharide pyruvyl transferase WcaK-like protein
MSVNAPPEGTLRIFVPENIPSLNKGELCILQGMLRSVKPLGNIHMDILSGHSRTDQMRYPSEVHVVPYETLWFFCGNAKNPWLFRAIASSIVILQHIVFFSTLKVLGRKSLRFVKSDILRSYAHADLILANHNGVFGLGGSQWVPIMLYPVLLPMFCRLIDKPVAFYGGTLTPPKRLGAIAKKMFKLALSNFDVTTFREEESLKYSKALGVSNDRIAITADLAFLSEPAPDSVVSEIMRENGLHDSGRGLIGLTVTREIAREAFPELGAEKSYQRHNEILAYVLDRLVADTGARIVLVPHCIGYGQDLDDRIVASDVLHLCKKRESVTQIDKEYDAADLKGLIGRFDMMIGERLHSIISATTMCVPSLTIARSTDIRTSILTRAAKDCEIYRSETLQEDTLFDALMTLYSRRAEVKANLAERQTLMKSQAQENGHLLRRLLQGQP